MSLEPHLVTHPLLHVIWISTPWLDYPQISAQNGKMLFSKRVTPSMRLKVPHKLIFFHTEILGAKIMRIMCNYLCYPQFFHIFIAVAYFLKSPCILYTNRLSSANFHGKIWVRTQNITIFS